LLNSQDREGTSLRSWRRWTRNIWCQFYKKTFFAVSMVKRPNKLC
jgi:hypothetical protein